MSNNKEDQKTSSPELDLERIFAELGGEGSVAVSRKEPDWAKGHIRTVSLSTSDSISMDWLTAKFGGAKHQVRVYGPDGKKMIGSRTVEICAPPRDGFGIELVRGPEGNAVPVHRLDAEKKRYNELHGLPDTAAPGAQPTEQPAQAQPFDMSAMFAAMINQQNQANQTMMQMLVNRIQHLETLPTQQQPVVASAAVEPADPLGNLSNVVDVIGHLDKVKEKMGLSDREPPSETSGYIDLLKGFMEIHLENQKAKVTQAQTPPPPALPGPTLNTETPVTGAPAQNPQKLDISDDQLKTVIAQRLPALLANASPAERLAYAQEVAGQDLDLGHLDDYTDDPPGMENGFDGGQEQENHLSLDNSDDETGADTSNPESCNRAEQSDETPPPYEP